MFNWIVSDTEQYLESFWKGMKRVERTIHIKYIIYIFLDHFPHLCHHIYHNISAVVHSGLYSTLHSYKLFWAVCHLFPQRWRTLNIQSRETIGQDHITCLILGPRVNSSPAFLSQLQDAYFLQIRRLQTPLFSFTKFLRSSNTLLSAWINRREKQHHEWASQTFIYKDYETLSRLWETACF